MMKSEKKYPGKKIAAVLLFLAIAAGIYFAILPVFENKNIEALSKAYREFDKETFDVLFVGSSAMKNAVYPLRLYDEYGIASYNLGSGSQSLATSYYLIKEAIREHHPKVIVLDCINVQYKNLYVTDEIQHYVTDVMRYPEKLELVHDLIPSGSRLAFLFEMALYHDRINMLTKEDFTYSDRVTYGAKVHYDNGPFDDSYTVTKEAQQIPEISEEYLRKIIEYCQKTGTGIILTVMPLDYSRIISYGGDRTLWQKYYNYVQGIADEYGVPYLNFMHIIDETGISAQTDYDPDGAHLNYHGALKMSSYIGNYLKENIELPDVRSDPAYDFMRDDLDKFEVFTRLVRVQRAETLDDYLDALIDVRNDDYTVFTASYGPQGELLTAVQTEKLQELGIRDAEIFLDREYHSFAAVIDRGEVVFSNIGFGDDKSFYEGIKDGQKFTVDSYTYMGGYVTSIKIANREYSKNSAGLNFVVLDNKTGEVVDSAAFATRPEYISFVR